MLSFAHTEAIFRRFLKYFLLTLDQLNLLSRTDKVWLRFLLWEVERPCRPVEASAAGPAVGSPVSPPLPVGLRDIRPIPGHCNQGLGC